jgi:hypothetical protein
MITIRPVRTNDEVEMLHKAAADDNHMLAWPTHHVQREGETIGALSILPTVLVWLDTRKTKARESMQVQSMFEAMVANTSRCVLVPCVLNSPLLPYMEKVGYIDLGKIELFVKGI